MKNYEVLAQMLTTIASNLRSKSPEINLYKTTHNFVMGEVVVTINVSVISSPNQQTHGEA